jgi:hypothetical protein
LLKFEVPQVFLHDIGHSHPQPSREVLHRHPVLLLRVLEKIKQAVCQSLGISRGVELNCQLFALGHLPEIGDIGGDNRNAVRAC